MSWVSSGFFPPLFLSPTSPSLPPPSPPGLVDVAESSHAYPLERDLNNESLLKLKSYYRSLRSLLLDKSTLPDDPEAKKLAVDALSEPLSAMEELVRQLEVVVREPMRPGAGLLSIGAELAVRMGSLSVLVCDSGVFRCGVAASLDLATVLTRCHGLPPRSLRSALNTLRTKGGLAYVARKNNADIKVAFPCQPPK